MLELSSGERIVSTRASEIAAGNAIRELLKARASRGPPALGGPVCAEDLAMALQIPLALALNRLEVEENRGLLCRDESLDGTWFYRNYFVQ